MYRAVMFCVYEESSNKTSSRDASARDGKSQKRNTKANLNKSLKVPSTKSIFYKSLAATKPEIWPLSAEKEFGCCLIQPENRNFWQKETVR